MNKRALVTGNFGFVGRHIARQLQADGWYVRGVDIKAGGDARQYFRKSDEPYQYDLAIHLAAVVGGRATIENEPMKVAVDLAIDADFFNWVLRKRPRRAVYYSSSAAYPTEYQGQHHWIPLREIHIQLKHPMPPDAIYGWVKLTGEQLAMYANAEGAHVQVYRPFSGYGGDQDWTYPFPSILNRVQRGDDPVTVWGTGRQRRDWIHIDDIVRLTLAGTDFDAPQDPINLCTGFGTTMEQLARTAAVAAGRGSDIDVAPIPGAPSGVFNRVGDPTRMAKLLGLAEIDLAEGVERELRVIRERVESGDAPAD